MRLEDELERQGHYAAVEVLEGKRREREILGWALVSAVPDEEVRIRAAIAEIDAWIPIAEDALRQEYEQTAKYVDSVNDLELLGEQGMEELMLIADSVREADPEKGALAEKLFFGESE